MNNIFRYIILLFIIIYTVNTAFAQEKNLDSLRTKERIVIDGKKYFLHTVKKGDTEYSLCRIYNVFQTELEASNPEIYSGLKIGMKIKLPIIDGRNNSTEEKKPEVNKKDKYILHTVSISETLYFLHRKYNMSVSEIKKINPEITNNINEGQIIKILNPDYEEDTSKVKKKSYISGIHSDGDFIYYKVEKGNTLYSLSKKFHVSQKEIIFHNPETEIVLKIGQIVKLPKNSKNSHLKGNISSDSTSLKNIEVPVEIVEIEKDTIEIDTNKLQCFEVTKGETLYSISKKYKIEQDTIIKYNPSAEFSIQTGQLLCIPKTILESEVSDIPEEDKEFIYHSTKWNQSLESISELYGIKEKKIEKYNKEIDFNDLNIGQNIRIPKKYISKEIKIEIAETQNLKDSTILETEISEVVPKYHSFCDSIDFSNEEKTLNVALMLPFYLNVNDTLGLSDTLIEQNYIKEGIPKDSIDALMEKRERIFSKSEIFLEFYEGLLIAVDSLRNSGLNIRLSVFDTQKDTITVKEIVRTQVLDTMDFIIGPVYSINMKIVAEHVKNKNIKLISPLVSNNEFLVGNKNFFQVVPSLEVQLQLFTEQLTKFKDHNILMIYSGNKKDKQLLNLYKKNLAASMQKVTNIDSLNYKQIVYSEKSISEIDLNNDPNNIKTNIIEEALTKDSANLIILPSIRQGFVSNLIRQINTIYENNKDSLDITICGFPHWQRYENIELDYLYNLQLLSFSTSYINYSCKHTNNFIEKFRQNYHSEPTRFAFQAYDIMFYFSKNIHKFDQYFIDCINSEFNENENSLQSMFDFTKINQKGGFENSSIYLLKYNKDFSFEEPKNISKTKSHSKIDGNDELF